MSNRFIYILETYLGMLLCFCLDGWRSLLQWLENNDRFYQPTEGNLLFVKFIEQGALVLHYPAFAEAVERYGKDRVYICTFQSNKELLLLLNVLDAKNILCLDEKSLWAFVRSYVAVLRQCRKLHIKAVIDLEFFSRATAIFCYLTGAPVRAGYHRYKGMQNYRGNLFTHRLHYSHYEHLSRSSMALLYSISLPASSLPALPKSSVNNTNAVRPLPELPLPDCFMPEWHNHTMVIITPNLCDPLPLRKWPALYYAQYIQALQIQYPDVLVLLAGRQDEKPATDAFINQYGLQQTINLCGATSLHGLLALYQRASLLLCSDSGPGHFASLTLTPCIVLFGPETPVLYGSTAPNVHVLYESFPCSPCFTVYNNRLSHCSNNLCMQQISVESVLQKSIALLHAVKRHAQLLS